jgi:hypothetical protein
MHWRSYQQLVLPPTTFLAFIAIMLSACLLGSMAISAELSLDHRPAVQPLIRQPKKEQASKFAWPSLTQDQTVALGELLKRSLPGRVVVIWCPGIDCTALQSDFDDAFQIAGLKSDFDRRPVESNDDTGLFVGPPGPDAERLVRAIASTTGFHATVVEAPRDKPLALIIGKRPR